MRLGLICELGWSINVVYEGLGKELHKHGIDTTIIDIRQDKPYYIWNKIQNHFDYLFVPTHSELVNKFNECGLPDEKLIPIVHAPWELEDIVKVYGRNFLDRFPAVLCVSNRIKQLSKDLGITKKLDVVQNGVIFDRFYCEPSQRLVNVGYAYPMVSPHPWKRSKLVGKIDCGVVVPSSILPFYMMREFYKKIDASILVSTHTEACGLINLEAAAAGRMIISTDVGILEDYPNAPAIRVRMEEEDLIEDINNTIRYYRYNTEEFKRRCIETQEFAREYYDWSHAIKSWLTPLNTLNT